MISSNTRTTRSRYSSPAQSQNTKWNGVLDASKGATEGSRAFMQRWLEPTVQSKASFEDDGLVRYGVVENMAPLGSLPKPKKTGPETNSGVKRIILRPSGGGAAKNVAQMGSSDPVVDVDVDVDVNVDVDGDADADAEADVAITARAADSSPPPVALPPTPPRRVSIVLKDAAAAADDENDEDYDPSRPKRRQSGRTSLGRRSRRSSGGRRSSIVTKPTVKEAKEAKERRDLEREPKKTAKSAERAKSFKELEEDDELEVAGAITAEATIHAAEPVEPEDKEFADKVVEAAVDEALKHYRYPTAWALRTLYDERSSDPRFVAMIEEVFTQTADEATMQKFSREMQKKKREGKKDNQGCYYFIPPTTNSRFTPHKPKAAPYGKLLHHNQVEEVVEVAEVETEDESEVHILDSEEAEQVKNAHRHQARATKRAKTSHSRAHSSSHHSTSRPHTQTQAHAHAHTHSHSTRNTPRKMSSSNQPQTPSRKRIRRDSASSDSSLSSALSLSSPEAIMGSPSPVRRTGTGTSRPVPTGPDSSDAPKSRPITTRRKSLASKGGASSKAKPKTTKPAATKQPSPSAPTLSTSDITKGIKLKPTDAPASATISVSADASMPGRVSAGQIFPNLPTKSKTAKNKGSSSALAPASFSADDAGHDNDDSFWDRRRDAQKFANSVTATESSIRGGDEDEDPFTTPAKSTRKTRQSIAAAGSASAGTTRSTRSASKRPHDEIDSAVSPVAWSFQREDSSAGGSRAATPTLRPPKKPRTGLRIKSSPVKKRGGTAAGVPRPQGEALAANGVAKDQVSDNDEDCSACGAAGDVVCCDGCPRSFHFECVGMIPSDHLPDEWFCNECLYKRYPTRMPPYKGLFAAALINLEKSIPRAFSLPKKLQTRFEGVKAGAYGEYEEVTAAKTAKRKNGYEELPDFFKQRDEGQAVICHGCQKPATDVRAIIPCSICPFYWHIDCLDPPLAVPPVLKTWRCPLHPEEIMAEVRSLAPAHRFRKIKGTQTIVPSLTRGTKNNGYIEIDWEDEPEPANNSGWPDPDSFGRAYKLPAKGIVLDFIEQLVHYSFFAYSTSNVRTGYVVNTLAMALAMKNPDLALTLTSLKERKSDGVDQLITALVETADASVLSLMAKADASNLSTGHLTESDKLSLRVLLNQMDSMGARIRHLLGEPEPVGISATMQDQDVIPSILSPQDSAIAEPLDKVTAHPVTEPTPPSTIDHAEGSMDLD
ncbi:essential subunit of the histone deacetylase rpd3s complex [Fusarium circinatum]|uniref:Essential subunit of the histone deacetylase rpd3s complex n=1 Tax=Fusarium circinatum TaxID=48490 RepID=A0A8H5TPV0_FUSCI|nr:essential subunit of the histone deacetylase rpd3s complex [Fusarium circinatum]